LFAWILCGILSAICLLHLYWALGGQWALDKVNPTVDGKPLLKLNFAACFGAAVMFAIAAAVPVVKMNSSLRKWLLIAMTAAFLARAVGDFRYCGFFKSIKGTPFAYWDTRLYSPLTLVLAALAALCLG
jgi:hypothetical protein